MREGVALGLAAVVGDGFVAAGEAYGLEAEEADCFWIVQRKLDDASDLFIVDTVHYGYDRDDFYSGFMEIFNRFQFYVEQVADHAVRVGGVADAVELQIRVTHSGFDCLLAELKTFREFDSVGGGLHGVVPDFAGVAYGIEEIRRQRWLA